MGHCPNSVSLPDHGFGDTKPSHMSIFPTIHTRNPLADHLEDSLGRFGPDLDVLEIQSDLKTQTL